jgi:hypothetical protein
VFAVAQLVFTSAWMFGRSYVEEDTGGADGGVNGNDFVGRIHWDLTLCL